MERKRNHLEEMEGEREETHPCTVAGSHHIRVSVHCTIWYSGLMENTNSGWTDLVASKHVALFDAVTCAATLVPPEPNPVASLTCEENQG
jgi:hypothetical protein